MKRSFLAVAALLAGLTSVTAKDYTTSGRLDYTSQASDLAAVLGEVPEGPYVWTHTGDVNMYAGGLLQSLDDLLTLNPARLTLKDATVNVNSGNVTVAASGTVNGAEVGGSGELTLDHTEMNVRGRLNVNGGNNLGGNKAQHPTVGRLVLANGSRLYVKDILSISANVSKGDEWYAQVTNEIVLASGSVLLPSSDIERYDGPSGKIVFDGGRIEKPWDAATPFFGAFGYGHDGKSALLVTSTPGNDVVLSNNHTNNLFYGQNTGYLMSKGGIRKSGRGVLLFNGPSGNNFNADRLAFNGFAIDEGTVHLYNNFTFRDQDERGIVSLAEGATLDLNNNDATIRSLAGNGTIYASEGAKLTLAAEEDFASKVKIGPGITALAKRGNASAQVSALGFSPAQTSVECGTLAVVDPNVVSAGYTHYRFHVTAVNDTGNAKQIMELREIRLFGGEADVTYAKALTYDAETKQTDGTGVFGNNEKPEKAVDTDLNSKWCDLRYADQDCWWVEFIYDHPVQVTAYNWAKTDNLYRSPRSWQLEGSNDGESWTVLDERTMDTRYLTNNQWVSAEPFAVAAQAAAQTERFGAVTVAKDATLDLSGFSADVEFASLAGEGAVKLGTGRFIVNTDADISISLSRFAEPLKSLVKKGTGTLTLKGTVDPRLKVDLQGGEVNCAKEAFDGKFFRLTIKAIRNPDETTNRDGAKVMNLGKFHLYDADGNVVNRNLSWFGYTGSYASSDSWQNPSDGTPAKDLTPGTFSQAGQYKYSIWNGAHEAIKWIFADATDQNKWTTVEHVFKIDDASTWYTLNMRLSNEAKPVVGYNLRSIGDENREVAAWMLEGSADGVRWTTLDEKAIGTDAPKTAHTWYNGGTPYRLEFPVRPLPKPGFVLIVR